MTIRVLVVDDSRFVRRAVCRMLAEDAEIAIVGQASHAQEALEIVRAQTPDVITLDLDMPTIGGLDVLQRIMVERPTPVVIFSAHAQAGAKKTLAALAAGAVDFVDKSTVSAWDLYALGGELLHKVRLAARSHPGAAASPARASTGEGVAGWPGTRAIVVGASTGGPLAIQNLIASLPRDFGLPILIVQHMPASFAEAFAEHLGARSALPVRVAKDGERFEAGCVRVAAGGRHVELHARDAHVEIGLRRGGPKDLHVPSIDVAAASAAAAVGRAACLVVLTGMGTDGVEGASAVRRAGGRVIAQDEASSVIFGMPRAVAEAGLADRVVPLDRLPELFVRLASAQPDLTARRRRTPSRA